MTPYERVMARVERQSECLVSPSAPDDHGYSRVMVEGKPRFAHRIVWEHHHGPVPEGLGVLHRCDNPPCVETEPTSGYPHGHLFTGTQADNLADMEGSSPQPAQDPLCERA